MNAKKFFGSALLVATMLAGMNLCAAVESDVVGYSTITIDRTGYVMISLPYTELGADSAGYPIQNIAGTLSQFDSTGRADALMIMEPSTKAYTTYYYKTAGWVKDGETEATTDVIPAGVAVYLKKAMKAGEVVVSGRVLDDATVEVPLSMGLNLISNPYPVEIKIADITGTLSANNSAGRADAIMVLNPETKLYTTYQLKPIGWVKEGEETVTTDTIGACEGVVFKKMMKAGSITFTRPY